MGYFSGRRNDPRQPRRRARTGTTFQVKWSLDKSQKPFTENDRTEIQKVLLEHNGDRYNLLAYVIMTRTVTVIVMPINVQPLHVIIANWQRESARRLATDGQRDSWPWVAEIDERPLWSELGLVTAVEEILNKPKRRWPDADNYRWMETFELW